MKRRILVSLLFLVTLLYVGSVKAEYVSVSTANELRTYFSSGGEVKLESDITFTANTGVNSDVTVDLNGHTINMTNKTMVPYATITFKDTSSEQTGKVTGTGSFVIQIGSTSRTGGVILESGTIEGAGSYGVRNFGNLTINGGSIVGKSFVVYNQGVFVMNGGSVIASTGVGVRLNDDATFTMNNGLVKTNGDNIAIVLGNPGAIFTMNNGRVEAQYTNIPSGGLGVMAYKDTEVIINGGTVLAASHALGSNGSVDGSSSGTNAKFTINGGTITSEYGMGMYIPQPNGDTTINGGTITGHSAVEIRAGSLKVTGGTLNSNSDYYESASNTNGSTTKGASVSVVQHTTKLPINVQICGGIFNGIVPVSQSNPELNSEEDINKISINIDNSCGQPTFNSTSGNMTVYSENLTGFIRGGKYTYDVMTYVADGYGEKNEDNMKAVYKYRNITINDTVNGESILSSNRALFGDEIEIEHNPEEDAANFVLEAFDSLGNIINIENNKFAMPDDDVVVRVQYVKEKVDVVDPSQETNKIVVGVTDGDLAKTVMLNALKQNTVLYPVAKNTDPTLELVVREMELSSEDRNRMLESIKSEDGIVLKSFDVYVEVKDSNNNVIGTIRNLPEELVFAIVMPENVSTVAKNYSRKYIVVEDNDGYEVIEPDVQDNSVLLKTKKLSSYTVIYTDKKLDSDVLGDKITVNPPDTGDNIKYYFMIFNFLLIIFNVYLIKKFLFVK